MSDHDDEQRIKLAPGKSNAKKLAKEVRLLSKAKNRWLNLLRQSGSQGRSRRGAPQGGAKGRGGGTPGKKQSQAASATRHLQRASVRMTFSPNKVKGQWKAHGRYIARESATLENERERTDPELSPELPDIDKELDREQRDHYASTDFSNPRTLRTLRESYARALAERPSAGSFNGLRTLSRVSVVNLRDAVKVLLPGNAPDHLEHGRSKLDAGMRRPDNGRGAKSAGRAGAGNVKRGPGFGSVGEGIAIDDALDAWQKADDPHLFKFILSPEFGEKMDLRAYTRDFVKQLEADLGTPLQWIAADHYNTDHPHVHLAVRGIDQHGQRLRIDPGYVKKAMRERAQQIATEHLGFRTEKDVAEGFTRQITQQRYTEIDRLILKAATPLPGERGYQADYNLTPRGDKAREFRTYQIRRLTQLEGMGLAERTDNMTWIVKPNLESALRARQVGDDKLKTLFAHRTVLSDPRLQINNTDLNKTPRILGRFIGTGLDETHDKPYVLIEGTDGVVHYIYQSYEIQQARANGLKIGEFVVLQSSKFTGRDGKDRTKIRFESFGDAEALLTDKRRLAGEVFRTVNTHKQLPTERPYGGWLGRYHKALKDVGQDLFARGSIERTAEGFAIAQRKEIERKKDIQHHPQQPSIKKRNITR